MKSDQFSGIRFVENLAKSAESGKRPVAAKRRKSAVHGVSRGQKWKTDKPPAGRKIGSYAGQLRFV
jgi:hypothetical protein